MEAPGEMKAQPESLNVLDRRKLLPENKILVSKGLSLRFLTCIDKRAIVPFRSLSGQSF
jgi:hypothetical protein